MKHRIRKFIWAFLGLIGVICIVHSITPTFGRQIPFNQRVWKHDPVKKIRYYMSDSLIEKLNKEKPSIEETIDMLGNDSLGNYHPGETYLFYYLKSGALIGLAMYALDICFNEDGSFNKAGVVYSD